MVTIVYGKCPSCGHNDDRGWLRKSEPGDGIFPEEPESVMMERMCRECYGCASNPFCNNECLRVSYKDFHEQRLETTCDQCDGIMRGEEWAATCMHCTNVFCTTCVAELRASPAV